MICFRLVVRAEAPLGLLAGDLDREHCGHFGVAGDLLRGCAQLGEEGLAVDHRAVALGVGGFKEVAFDNLVTAKAGAVFDAVFDGVGLLGQGCDLGKQGAKSVNVVGDGGSSHFAVFLWLPAMVQWV